MNKYLLLLNGMFVFLPSFAAQPAQTVGAESKKLPKALTQKFTPKPAANSGASAVQIAAIVPNAQTAVSASGNAVLSARGTEKSKTETATSIQELTAEQKAAREAIFRNNKLALNNYLGTLKCALQNYKQGYRDAVFEKDPSAKKKRMTLAKERDELIDLTIPIVKAQIERFLKEKPINLSTPSDAVAMLWTRVNCTDITRDHENNDWRELAGAIDEVWEASCSDECAECWCCC